MAIRLENIIQELDNFQASDDTILKAIKSAQDLLILTKASNKYSNIKIVACDFSPDKSEKSLIYTDNCKIFTLVPAIVFNVHFLQEVEAIIRSFALSKSLFYSQYFQSDLRMYELVYRIANFCNSYLIKLRKTQKEIFENESLIYQQLIMTIFYFICHEIGHLIAGENQKNYASFIDINSPLESSITNAVVKMGMHLEDLEENGFSLENVMQNDKSYKKIKQVADSLQKTVEQSYNENKNWFKNEKDADENANRIIIEYIDNLNKQKEKKSDITVYCFVHGLFAIALYSWYKDLSVFLNKLSLNETLNAQILSLEMAKKKDNYIHAASLFGNNHRFTLLRANLTIEAVLKSQSSWFNEDPKTRTIWYSQNPTESPADTTMLKKWNLSENLQRYYLLRRLMDTAVKLAFIGYSTGWIKEVDTKRGTPQLFFIQFYSIQSEMDNLRHFY